MMTTTPATPITPTIDTIQAREILDSRGYPTVEVDVILSSGARGRASVPSGASTGCHEALEKRDGDPQRYGGKGVRQALSSVHDVIAPHLKNMPADVAHIDGALIALDGTPDKSRLGANAVLGVSLAAAKAAADHVRKPLYAFLSQGQGTLLPMPLMNVLNGGAHGDNGIDIQEFMIIPHSAPSMAEAIRMGAEVFHALKAVLMDRGLNTNVGDEGGFAPNLQTSRDALSLLMTAVTRAGYRPGKDILFALDVAASTFYGDGLYHLRGENQTFTALELTAYYRSLCHDFPIVSIEDGMAEDDWAGWKILTDQVLDGAWPCGPIQIVGDDLFVTNVHRLQMGIDRGTANAILIKPNQIGTLTETKAAIDLAKNHAYGSIVSHRSGETEDATIADLAVAFGTGQIKTGSLSRTDRLAKYNQLLRIEEDLGDRASFRSPFAPR